MQCRADELVEGAHILAHILSADSILIGIEDNKPDAIARVQAAISRAGATIELATFPTKYPSGGEKQIIEILTGQQVPSGGIPADIGIVCVNPGTAVATQQAIIDGKPLTHRIVTLTGEALAAPQNVSACLGTPITQLLEHAALSAEAQQRIIHGGPMMGFAVSDLNAPITKITNCLLAPTATELPLPEPAQPCIRCGHCAEACPASLLPQQLVLVCPGKGSGAVGGASTIRLYRVWGLCLCLPQPDSTCSVLPGRQGSNSRQRAGKTPLG